MLEEAVAIIREMFTGDLVTHDGDYYSVHTARLYTLPDEPPPIMVAASGPLAAEVAGRVGDGDWDFVTYWTRTYGAVPRPNGWDNTDANRPSRYEVYRYEIDNNLVNTPTAQGNPTETGAPSCYAGGASTLTDEPDRRVFVGAIINCEAADAAGQLNGSSGGTIPVEAYGKFFLTEPMDKQDGTIWVEMVQIVEPGTAAARNIIHDNVQLYR
jgi:hypothetical protein